MTVQTFNTIADTLTYLRRTQYRGRGYVNENGANCPACPSCGGMRPGTAAASFLSVSEGHTPSCAHAARMKRVSAVLREARRSGFSGEYRS